MVQDLQFPSAEFRCITMPIIPVVRSHAFSIVINKDIYIIVQSIKITHNKFFILFILNVYRGSVWSQVWVRALDGTIKLPYSCTWGPVRLCPPLDSPLTGVVHCFEDLAADYREPGIMRFDDEMRHPEGARIMATASPYTDEPAEIWWAFSEGVRYTSF